LEIGVGIGTDAINFLKAGADYYGIDISEKSLKIAKQRLSIYGFDSNRLKVINAEEVDQYFLKNSFDLVYSFGVIHHTPNPEKVVNATYHLLKSGGLFKLMLYAKESWKSYMIEIGLD
jgi:ubiquinone/menaquinone biosynthesis C-methylase UbiE